MKQSLHRDEAMKSSRHLSGSFSLVRLAAKEAIEPESSVNRYAEDGVGNGGQQQHDGNGQRLAVPAGAAYPPGGIEQDGIKQHSHEDTVLAQNLHQAARERIVHRYVLPEPAVVVVSSVAEQRVVLVVQPFEVHRLEPVQRADILVAVFLRTIVQALHLLARQPVEVCAVTDFVAHEVEGEDVPRDGQHDEEEGEDAAEFSAAQRIEGVEQQHDAVAGGRYGGGEREQEAEDALVTAKPDAAAREVDLDSRHQHDGKAPRLPRAARIADEGAVGLTLQRVHPVEEVQHVVAERRLREHAEEEAPRVGQQDGQSPQHQADGGQDDHDALVHTQQLVPEHPDMDEGDEDGVEEKEVEGQVGGAEVVELIADSHGPAEHDAREEPQPAMEEADRMAHEQHQGHDDGDEQRNGVTRETPHHAARFGGHLSHVDDHQEHVEAFKEGAGSRPRTAALRL